ncbi:MAG TPA: hypothetical protein VJT09_05650 [Pyrinomonadaceae bacterium]|nr:hypothetical protein [Pyrinomonadaceae bacterium]
MAQFERGLEMSVIGRLDKQVEEVLIAPIARRHEQAAKEREKEKEKQRQKRKQDEEKISDPEGVK